MKNSFGNNITITLFGESHGAAIGAVLDGIAPGIAVDREYIAAKMAKRKSTGDISTPRHEADEVEFLSGVFEGKTTGTPIAVVIKNSDTKSRDYSKTRPLARPGHADYTAFCKYHGYEDYRGGGHFSGRLTAPIVALGAICQNALQSKGIYIGTHIARCKKVSDRTFCDFKSDIISLENSAFPLLDMTKKEEIEKEILAAKASLDSVGGVLETAVYGMPAGVGEPFFDSVESVLSHALFSIPAVKGVEFGAGFAICDMLGSEANDSFYMDGDKVRTRTNNNGGINGGITNGNEILFRCAIKPTPSVAKKQETVNFFEGKDAEIEICGRHDPAILHRAAVVVDSITAITICDLLSTRYGTDFLA